VLCVVILYGRMGLGGRFCMSKREWERGLRAEVGEGEIPFLLWAAWLIEEGLARADARAPRGIDE
jgi:hypothetical protein